MTLVMRSLVTLRTALSEEWWVLRSYSYNGPEKGLKKRRKESASGK